MDRTRLLPPVFVPPVAAQLGSGPALMDPVRAALAARRLRAGTPQYAGPAGPPAPTMPVPPPLPVATAPLDPTAAVAEMVGQGALAPPTVPSSIPGGQMPGGSPVPGDPYLGMMGWPRDVATATAQAVRHPSKETVMGALGATIPPPARPVLQKPQEFVATKIGDLAYQAATGAAPPDWLANLPFGDTFYGAIQGMATDEGTRQKIIAAHDEGGGLGTFWGAVVDTSDMSPTMAFITQFAAAMLTDPWTYVPILAAGGKSVETAGRMSALEKGGTEAATAGDTARIVAGQALQAPNVAANIVGGLPFELAGHGIGAARSRLGLLGRAFSPSESALRQEATVHTEDLFDTAAAIPPDDVVPQPSATTPTVTGTMPDGSPIIDVDEFGTGGGPIRGRAAATAEAPTPLGEYTVVRMGPKDFQVLDPDGTPVLGNTGKPMTFQTHRVAAAEAERRTARDALNITTEPPADIAGTVPPPEPTVTDTGATFRVPTQKKAYVREADGTLREATPEEQAAAGVYTQQARVTAPEDIAARPEPVAEPVGPNPAVRTATTPGGNPIVRLDRMPKGLIQESMVPGPYEVHRVGFDNYANKIGNGTWQVRAATDGSYIPGNEVSLAGVDGPFATLDEAVAKIDQKIATSERLFGGKPSTNVARPGTGRDVPVTPTGPLREHWLNPETGRTVPYKDFNRPPSVPEFVAYELGQVDRPMAEAWWKHVEEDPRTADFVAEQQAFDRRPSPYGAGASGAQRDSAEKILSQARHEIEVQRQHLQDLLGDTSAATHVFRHGNELHPGIANAEQGGGRRGTVFKVPAAERGDVERNAVERAIFGTDEEATRARQYLHVAAKTGTKAARERATRLLEGANDLRTKRLAQEGAVPPGVAVETPTEREMPLSQEVRANGAEPITAPVVSPGKTADVGTTANGPDIVPPLRPNRLGIPELPGEIAPIEDTSTLGQAFNTGKIGAEHYADLNRTISIGGKPMRFIDIVHQALADNPDSRSDAMSQVRGIVAAADGLTAPDRGRLLRAIDTALAAYRENVMFNAANIVRGPVSDQAGDMLAMGVTGHPDAAVASLSVRNAYRWVKYQRGAKRMIEQMPQVQRLNRFGVKVRRDLLEALQRSETDTSSEEMVLTAGAKKVPVVGGALSKVTPVFASKLARDIRTALDHNRRLSLHLSVFLGQVPEARATLVGLARREGGDAMADAVRMLPEEFSPDDVLAATGSEQLARQWRGLVNAIDAAADAEQNRVLFSYRMTNLDAKLKYAIMFHYWLSRATLLHTKAAFQNPALMNAYLRGFEGLKQVAEEEGLPGPLRTYFKFMGDVGGWYALADPIGALLPYSIARDMFAGDDREKERTFDKIVRKTGIFVSPMVEVAAAMLGATDKAPDPTATWAIRGYAKVFFDYARNHGLDLGTGPGITEDPVERIERKVFETASDLAQKSGMVPFAKKLDAFDRVANEQTQVLDVLKAQMEAEYGPFDGWNEDQRKEFLEAQTAIQFDRAEENPRAQAALANWSAGKAKGKAAALAVPAGVQTFYGPRQQRIALKNEGYVALDTNAEPTPEQQSAMAATQQINADNEPGAAQAVTEQDLYGKLGTPIEQDIVRNWNMLAHGTADDFAKAGTNFVWSADGAFQYSVAQVLAMDEEERKALADGYLARNGYETQYKDLRDAQTAFKDTNPIYGGYTDWVSLGRDKEKFPGGIPEFRDLMMRKSESYRKYIGRLNPETRKDPEKFDRASTSMEAYLSLRGIEGSVYKDELGGDPAASADVDMWVKLLENTGGFGGSQKKYDLTTPEGQLKQLKDKMAEYEKKLKVYNSHVLPMTNGIPFEQLPPEFQGLVSRRLKARNIERPSEPGIINAYRMWQVIQPDPAAATPEAYVAWLAQHGQFDTTEEPAA